MKITREKIEDVEYIKVEIVETDDELEFGKQILFYDPKSNVCFAEYHVIIDSRTAAYRMEKYCARQLVRKYNLKEIFGEEIVYED